MAGNTYPTVVSFDNADADVVFHSNMKAELLLDERVVLDEDCFVELVVWRLPAPARGSAHGCKYRLALIEDGICTLRYDNGAGKGDHRHIGGGELSYTFTTPEDLLADFWSDADMRRGQ